MHDCMVYAQGLLHLDILVVHSEVFASSAVSRAPELSFLISSQEGYRYGGDLGISENYEALV